MKQESFFESRSEDRRNPSLCRRAEGPLTRRECVRKRVNRFWDLLTETAVREKGLDR